MNIKEFELLKKGDIIKKHILTVDDLNNKQNRTLLYGYTCNRETWHVYLKDEVIYTVMYGGYDNIDISEVYVKTNNDYIPNKRLYPECCDYEFCKLLKEYEVFIPFTTYNKEREYSQYYGKLI